MKVQHLICLEDRAAGAEASGGKGSKEHFFSIQMHHDQLRDHAASLRSLFAKGKTRLGRFTAKSALSFYQKTILDCCVTHEFTKEMSIMQTAAAHGITPPLHEWYIVRTGKRVAIGVYIQARASCTFEDMQSVQFFDFLVRKGASAFKALASKCAAAGLAHIDLIPSNIAIYEGDIVLIDFGLALDWSPYMTTKPTTMLYFEYLMLRLFYWQAMDIEGTDRYIFGHPIDPASPFHDPLTGTLLPNLKRYRDQCKDSFLSRWKEEKTTDAMTYSRGEHMQAARAKAKAILSQPHYNSTLFTLREHVIGGKVSIAE